MGVAAAQRRRRREAHNGSGGGEENGQRPGHEHERFGTLKNCGSLLLGGWGAAGAREAVQVQALAMIDKSMNFL